MVTRTARACRTDPSLWVNWKVRCAEVGVGALGQGNQQQLAPVVQALGLAVDEHAPHVRQTHALLGLDLPAPDFDLLLYLGDAEDLQDEPGLNEGGR